MTFREFLAEKVGPHKGSKKADGSMNDSGLTAKKVSKATYHKEVNKLPKDKRAYIDDTVVADEYYLATEDSEVVGGFGVRYDGYLTGLFGLKKGYGKKVFQLRLSISGKKVKGSNKLNLFCIGDFLRDMYKAYGFKVYETLEWDDQYAPKNWDYDKYGRPNLYEMTL